MGQRGATLDVSAWEAARVDVMRELLTARWEQHQLFRDVLCAVAARGWRLLHFERSGASSFWGGVVSRTSGEVEGGNMLGNLLMEVISARCADASL